MATAGKATVEEQAAKFSKELLLATEERDAAKGDAASRTQELSEGRASLFDAERREAVVREAYGAMSASSYQSMLALWDGLAEAEVTIEPSLHAREDGPASWPRSARASTSSNPRSPGSPVSMLRPPGVWPSSWRTRLGIVTRLSLACGTRSRRCPTTVRPSLRT